MRLAATAAMLAVVASAASCGTDSSGHRNDPLDPHTVPLQAPDPDPLHRFLRPSSEDVAYLEFLLEQTDEAKDYPCLEVTLGDALDPNYEVDRECHVCRVRIWKVRQLDFEAAVSALEKCGVKVTQIFMRLRGTIEGKTVVATRSGQVFQLLGSLPGEEGEASRDYVVVPLHGWRQCAIQQLPFRKYN